MNTALLTPSEAATDLAFKSKDVSCFHPEMESFCWLWSRFCAEEPVSGNLKNRFQFVSLTAAREHTVPRKRARPANGSFCSLVFWLKVGTCDHAYWPASVIFKLLYLSSLQCCLNHIVLNTKHSGERCEFRPNLPHLPHSQIKREIKCPVRTIDVNAG